VIVHQDGLPLFIRSPLFLEAMFRRATRPNPGWKPHSWEIRSEFRTCLQATGCAEYLGLECGIALLRLTGFPLQVSGKFPRLAAFATAWKR
jgi:hypothetical protein